MRSKTKLFEVTEERIIKACNLIVTTDKRIKDIADECGFKSQSYFISAFGASFGMTPTNFRRFFTKTKRCNNQSVKK